MINNIVLDSNAFFKGNTLLQLVKQASPFTTPSVMHELKDQKTKDLLQSFPFKIEVRQPSKEAIKFIRGFAAMTGDSQTLSDTDVGVIALAYDLVGKIGMGDKLNKEPKEFKEPESESDWEEEEETKGEKKKEGKVEEEKIEGEKIIKKEQQLQTKQVSMLQTTQPLLTQQQQLSSAPQPTPTDQDDGWIQVKAKPKKPIRQKQSSLNSWITPENYSQKKSKGLLTIHQRHIAPIPQSSLPVWLITGDFAMQNVSMQIGIPTKSSDGHQIHTLKRYVQMCFCCGKVMKEGLDKIVNCPKCGYNTLSKVAYTVDQGGNLVLHRKKGWEPNKQVMQWKQKKMEEERKAGRYQRKRKQRAAFE